jgi:hypothetical protein
MVSLPETANNIPIEIAVRLIPKIDETGIDQILSASSEGASSSFSFKSLNRLRNSPVDREMALFSKNKYSMIVEYMVVWAPKTASVDCGNNTYMIPLMMNPSITYETPATYKVCEYQIFSL